MENTTLQHIRHFYNWDDDSRIEPLSSGLINHTWKVSAGHCIYILQKINTTVFNHPEYIDENFNSLKTYFKQNHPDYLFVAPIAGTGEATLFKVGDDYYRAFNFIEGSHTTDIAQSPEQAYEAAFQFGRFTSLLTNFEVSRLKTTLPGFHNLASRFLQFESALLNTDTNKIGECNDEILFIYSRKKIVEKYQAFISHSSVKTRPTHHDTKISNVLFDKNDKGICVIDFDTVMPGHFLSDVGDMIRTFTCPFSEEEKDMDKIVVREPFLDAIKEGYIAAMQDELTAFEKAHFFFSGEVLILMQALRFLTDYLNNDVYYGSSYPKQNLVRANNQIRLLQQLQRIIH